MKKKAPKKGKSTAKSKPPSFDNPKSGTKKTVAQPFFRKTRLLPAFILVVIPFALYFSSLSFDYVLDDKLVLSENNFVKKGVAGLGDIFSTESFTGFLGQQQDLVVGARYRPLSLALFAVEHQLFGKPLAENSPAEDTIFELDPKVGHFLNIFFYALTGLLIFRLISFFYSSSGEQPRYVGVAFLTALFFIAHPVHTEVVSNIKGRDEIMALLLSLGALYYSVRYAKYGGIPALIFSGIAFFPALLAKENSLTFLAVIPLTLYLFTKASLRQIAISMVPLLISFAVYMIIRVNVIGYLLDSGKEITGIMNNPFVGTTFGEKYATIMYTLGLYIKLLIFPHPLTHDYYPYQIPIINWGDWRALLSLALYTGIAVVAIRSFRKRSVTAWSVFYYLLTLSIVSNIVFPVGAPMNERFLYMPSLGFCFLLAWLLMEKLPERFRTNAGKYAAWGLTGLILTAYGIKTITRVPAWKDAMSLNRAAIKVSTNSARANSYMAYSLYRLGLETNDPAEKQRIFDEAMPYVNKALDIYPEYSDAITCKSGLLAAYYQMDGNLDKLLGGFYELLSARHVSFISTYLEYLNPRANSLKMIDFYHRAGYQLLGKQQQNYPLAITFLNYGLSLDAGNLQLLQDLADIYLDAGQYNNAIQTAQRGLQIDPADPALRRVLQEAGQRSN